MSEPTNAASSARPPGPGSEHELLKSDVGTWDAAVEIYLAPGSPTQVSRGIAQSRLGCGGRWLITDFRNETTGFEGHAIHGFDPTKGKYVGTWVDPMRSFLAVSEGTYDPATKTMTMWFEASGPQGKLLRWRETTERTNEDTRVWRSIMKGPDGQEFEMMKTVYTRRK